MERYIPPSRRGVCTECGKTVGISRTSSTEPRCRDCQRRNPKPRHKAGPHSIVRWTCERCGKVCERPPTKGQHPKWCGPACAAQGRFPIRTKVCGWCKVEYRTRERRSTACSAVHGRWLAQHGAPSDSHELVLVPREPTPWRSRLQPSRLETPWWRVIVQGDCAWCGESFTAPSTTGVARYCSDSCTKRATQSASRQKRGRFVASERRCRRLYERDRWTCRVCGDPTSRTYVQGDPWSPTLDHIEPQTHALIADHSDANLRTAHALCNSLRGDGRLTDAEVRELVAERRSADVPA